MMRDLPRGPFGAYLRAHCLNETSGFLPRFSMGCGGILMVQRVKPITASLLYRGSIAETDPALLEEMISLIAALKLDVISLAEMRRRLVERDLSRRFICFTFDGAYRSIKDFVFPLFEKHRMPFTVYAATDYLDQSLLPWWLALEVLLNECDKISLDFGDERVEVVCASLAQKQRSYEKLFRRLQSQDWQSGIAILEAAFRKHGLDRTLAASKEMLSPDELKSLVRSGLVTVGTQAGGGLPLNALTYDRARESIKQSLHLLDAAIGSRPQDLAFPGGRAAKVTARDVKIAGDLGLKTAVTSIEGALWPEHAHELHSLPRIALDNDPATLVRALMLSGGSPNPSDASLLAGHGVQRQIC